MGILGQVILHQGESLILVPVGILNIQNFNIGVVYHFGKALNSLIIDDRWDTAQHNYLAFVAELFGQPTSGICAHRNIVTRDVEILNLRIGQSSEGETSELQS